MSTYKDLLALAIKLATNEHYKQFDKNGEPYILHPLRVMFKMDDDLYRIAAILHDVVEDTKITLKDLTKEDFPPIIIQAVDALTRKSKEPFDDYANRVKKNMIAVHIKIADLEDNMDFRRLPGQELEDWNRVKKYYKLWIELKDILRKHES